MAGNDPGLSSTNELQEWTLEKQETEQVTFRLADTLLKLRPLTNNAVRVIRSMGIAHEVPELVYLPKIAAPATETSVSTLEEMELQMIQKAIEKCNGNLSAVAAQLGITRQTLYNKMKKFGL